MNELFDKKYDLATKEIMSLSKTSRVHIRSCEPTKRCAMKMNQERRKNNVHVNNYVFDGRTHVQKSREISSVYKTCT